MRRYAVIVLPQAKRDLRHIRDRIAVDSPINARRFLAKLRAEIRMLADTAGSHARVPEADDGDRAIFADLRQRIVSPYRVVYRVAGRRAEVVTVWHGARDAIRPGDIE